MPFHKLQDTAVFSILNLRAYSTAVNIEHMPLMLKNSLKYFIVEQVVRSENSIYITPYLWAVSPFNSECGGYQPLMARLLARIWNSLRVNPEEVSFLMPNRTSSEKGFRFPSPGYS